MYKDGFSQNGWNVLINGEPVTFIIDEKPENAILYFTYEYTQKTVEIIGTNAIPEFPSWIILPLFITFTLIIFVVGNKLRKKE